MVQSAPGETRRRQSRVTEHIMGANRASRRRTNSGRYRDLDDTAEDTQSLRKQQQPVGVGGSGRDTIALHGSREDVMYRGSAQHPGRIGSALSLPHSIDSHYDLNEHYLHHDDIVEHLDDIGAWRIHVARACFSTKYVSPPDPQVATVATLTDAANTIVLYVPSLVVR